MDTHGQTRIHTDTWTHRDVLTHGHTHTQTWTHAYTNIHGHTCTTMHRHTKRTLTTGMDTWTYAHMDTYMCRTCTHTDTLAQRHTHTDTHPQTHRCMHTHTYRHKYMDTCTHTDTPTDTQEHVHTLTRGHTHVYPQAHNRRTRAHRHAHTHRYNMCTCWPASAPILPVPCHTLCPCSSLLSVLCWPRGFGPRLCLSFCLCLEVLPWHPAWTLPGEQRPQG